VDLRGRALPDTEEGKNADRKQCEVPGPEIPNPLMREVNAWRATKSHVRGPFVDLK
jgi:hypothetical protein